MRKQAGGLKGIKTGWRKKNSNLMKDLALVGSTVRKHLSHEVFNILAVTRASSYL